MARKIYMNVAEGDECRIAVLEDGKLFEYFVDRPSQLKHVGNIYKGIINNIEPGIQAAFVDIGLERNGFLHVSDVNYAYENNPDVTKLFSRTLRIREPQPEDAILTTAEDREVEQVEEFASPTPTNGKGAEEAPFLETLNGDHPGHKVTESPLEVAPSEHEPQHELKIGTDTTAVSQPVDTGLVPAALAAIAAPPAAPDSPQPGDDGRRRRRRRRRRGGRGRNGDRPPLPAGTTQSTPGGEAAPTALGTPAAEPPSQPLEQAPASEAHPSSEQAPQAKPHRSRRRRVPKKRGGHLPKRVLEDGAPPEPKPEQDGTGTHDIDGNGGGGPAPGPQYRYNRSIPKLQNLLRRNQEVIVQVTKASQGGKGPGISTFISLPGRYMVLTPSSDRGGVSRKIEDGGARAELRKMLDKLPVPEGMGIIIRTAAIDRSYDDLLRDLNYLLRVWSVIVERIHEAPAPALLYSDSDPAIRAVRDYFTAETEEIVIDNREVFDRVVAFFDQLMPSFRDRVKLYQEPEPLFFATGLENQIEHIFDKKVPLKSGGYLFVEQTEALISIDINSGKFTGGGDAERTAFLTNMEAIPELCRQLRLRDLGGIVCCDFIDLANARHRHDVENALKRELRRDRARTKVARFSPFGVIEMTRQRVRPSIKAYTFVGCPTCGGFGMVRSAETMCLSLIRRMKLALGEERVKELAVQVHPHVLSHLHSEFREDVDELEDAYGKRLVFEYARDLVLGQSRFFYVNERGVKVLYDIDQRINSFVKEGALMVASSAPLPPAPTGGASPQTGPVTADGRRRRRRGGRRQREREQQRVEREQRIETEGKKAVTFGDKLPEQLSMEVIRESGPPPRDDRREERRGRGRRGRRGERPSREGERKLSSPPPASADSAPAAEAVQPDVQPAGGQAAATIPKQESEMAKKKGKKPAKKAARKPVKKTARKPAKKAAKKPAKRAPAKRKAAPKAAPSDE